MIIVTGATGKLGTQIVDRLLERVPATEVGVSVRDVTRAAVLAEKGVRVRAGDFLEPATLEHAFEGADRVLVISASIMGPVAADANRAAVDAAQAAGAGRIVYTSHQAASRASLFAPQTVHAATQEHLSQMGIPFTALRNGFYSSALGMHVAGALETGSLIAPADGPVSWTAHADLAELAVIALTTEGVLDSITPPLTAPDMLDLEAVAAILSELTGRTITRVIVDDDEWKASASNRGYPPQAADFALGMFRAARRGEFAVVDPTLERVLGRPATPASAVLADIVAQ
jgi:NAD(P)H dehydrogenase (quinone)